MIFTDSLRLIQVILVILLLDWGTILISGSNSAALDTSQEDSISKNSKIDKVSPFEELVGSTLYQWKIEGNEGEIQELSTSALLFDKKVVALYFSASWCGPCRQFTPALVQFYNEMNKKGKKFEIIWISRDRTSEEFVDYYSKMPWLAMTVENIPSTIEILSNKYQVKGIPHLVILDGQDASVYTLDGRTQVLKDKYGLEFPWQPKSLMNLMPKSLRKVFYTQIDFLQKKFTNVLQGVLESIAPKKILFYVYEKLQYVSGILLDRVNSYLSKKQRA